MVAETRLLEQAAAEGVCPGGQIAVLCAGEIELGAAGRLAGPDSPPVTDAVVYDLASLTKALVTAPLVFRAVEAGACGLSDRIRRFIPGAPDVTLADLLDHSAGLPAHRRFDERLPADVAPGSRAAHEHVVAQVASVPLEATPGSRATYSDLGFILLGAALERMGGPLPAQLAGLGWPELWMFDRRDGPVVLPERLFAPTEGDWVGTVHDENARAMGGAAGHAGLFGTARGVAAAAASLLGCLRGERGPLSEASIRAMWAPSGVPGSTRTAGWDRPTPGRSSAGTRWPLDGVGHLGFTGTSLWIAPSREVAVALVTNRVWPSRADERIRQLRPAIHDAVWLRLFPPDAG